MRRWARRSALLAVVVTVPLVAPLGAQAATKTVQAGPFGPDAKPLQRAAGDVNAFFRRVVTIHAGDRVRWKINGFHTVTFAPRGGGLPPLFAPDPATPLSGVLDAAGAPFWFNGQPRFVLNPAAATPQGGSTFRAGELHNSGLPLSEGPPKPYELRFPRKGTYGYVCLVHPGMAATVRVLGRSKAVPTARQDRREARRELVNAVRKVTRLSTGIGTQGLRSTIQAGNDRRSGATVYKFFPARATVKVGETVTLRMSPRTTEAHTFSFGPSNGKDQYLDQLAEGFIAPDPAGGNPPAIVADARVVLPSEPPTAGIPAYTGTNHGNGFWSSGILDRDPESPSPGSVKVRFTQAGTYGYICLIHPFMRGSVVVRP
jgi:plastocyanin